MSFWEKRRKLKSSTGNPNGKLPFWQSFRARLILGVGIVHAVLMGLFIADLTYRQKSMLISQQKTEATMVAQLLAGSCPLWLATNDVAGLQELVDVQKQHKALHFSMITDVRGLVLAHTERDKLGLEVVDLPTTSELTVIHSSNRLTDIAAPVLLNNRHVGWVRVAIGSQVTQAEMDQVIRAGLLYALLAVVIGTIVAWLMGYRITHHLYGLQQTIDHIKDGHTKMRVHLKGNDEVSRLGAEFNRMLDILAHREAEVKDREDRLRETNARLEVMVKERTDQLEQSLALVERRGVELEVAQNVARVGSWSVDLVKESLTWSKETYRIFGFDCGTPLSFERFLGAIHTDDLRNLLLNWEDAKAGGTYKIEYRITADGQEKWVQERAVFQMAEGREPTEVIGTIQDITERKNGEQALAKAKEAAEAASRAKSDFLAMMSHEIRTPLNGIIGLSQLMDTSVLPNKQRGYLRKMDMASKALLNLLNNVLDYSKAEAKQLILEERPFSLLTLVRNVTELFSIRAEEKGIALSINISSTVPSEIVGDETRLGQVLSNLIGNAVKFTQSGDVRISVEASQKENGRFLTRFEVTDTGEGISAANQRKLFQVFSQVDSSASRRHGGSGLGLSICKNLVALMGGEIGVESTPNKGSTFYFTIDVLSSDRNMSVSSKMVENDSYEHMTTPMHPLHLLKSIPFEEKERLRIEIAELEKYLVSHRVVPDDLINSISKRVVDVDHSGNWLALERQIQSFEYSSGLSSLQKLAAHLGVEMPSQVEA